MGGGPDKGRAAGRGKEKKNEGERGWWRGGILLRLVLYRSLVSRECVFTYLSQVTGYNFNKMDDMV